jgi:hypothetical protein
LDDDSVHNSSNSEEYGQAGPIAGRHCIRCHGIGFPPIGLRN